jgi:hypothetical protein
MVERDASVLREASFKNREHNTLPKGEKDV